MPHRAKTHASQKPKPRGTSSERGYGWDWQKARKRFLSEHPWCSVCLNEGRYVPATEVDHLVPHKGSMAIFWDESRWDAKCKTHHSAKTAKEDGGFGR